ncbi:MAG: hypothetical protein ACP5TK_02075 [Candidatus Micrarchaeia archaeon]
MLLQMLLVTVMLSVGAVNALVPIIIILILIAAAAAVRGTNLLQMFGISALAGIGIAGRGSLSQRNAFNMPARSLLTGKVKKNLGPIKDKISKKTDPYSGDKKIQKYQEQLLRHEITPAQYKTLYNKRKQEIDKELKLQKMQKKWQRSGSGSAMGNAVEEELSRNTIKVKFRKEKDNGVLISPLYAGTTGGLLYRNAKKYAVGKDGKPVKIPHSMAKAEKSLKRTVNSKKASAYEKAMAQEQLDTLGSLRHQLTEMQHSEAAKMKEFNKRRDAALKDLEKKRQSGEITKNEYKKGKKALRNEELKMKRNFFENHASTFKNWYENEWVPNVELKTIVSQRNALDQKFLKGEVTKEQYRKELSDIKNHLEYVAPNGEYDTHTMQNDINYKLEKGIFPKKEWSPERESTRGIKEFEERNRINKRINKKLK